MKSVINNHASVKTTIKKYSQSDDSIRILEQNIITLENELQTVESRIRALELQISKKYDKEILRIRELVSIYKKQKIAKKEKRLEQKKRGKNYREPTSLKRSINSTNADQVSVPADKLELKRLYREAVRQVHPDKFVNETDEKSKRSQELTIQLIDIYQSGDLEQLKYLYHHIMSGNAMAQIPSQKNKLPDPEAMHSYLTKKLDDLRTALNNAKQSRIYEVFSTYDDPQRFIDELADQFVIRIKQLEKRVRISKPIAKQLKTQRSIDK